MLRKHVRTGPLSACPLKRIPAHVLGRRFDRAAWYEQDGRVVSLFAYMVDRNNRLHALGTWTSAPFRRQGLASGLWRVVLELESPREVLVRTINSYGHTLVLAVRARFPRIAFHETQRSRFRRDVRVVAPRAVRGA